MDLAAGRTVESAIGNISTLDKDRAVLANHFEMSLAVHIHSTSMILSDNLTYLCYKRSSNDGTKWHPKNSFLGVGGSGPFRLVDRQAPPTFTLLYIEDPTLSNDRIIVTFTLNEPGTAYCRPTRRDSGETAADMHINRILTASWSSTFVTGDFGGIGCLASSGHRIIPRFQNLLM